jgi:citrate synthase
METKPRGSRRAVYEFRGKRHRRPEGVATHLRGAEGLESCYHLIAGISSLAAAIARLRSGHLPLEPDPDLGHAANFVYMMTGRRPTPLEERIMDVSLILHADHGMNASTFAAMVVASTLSDIYFSIGSGIAALNGPLHGGANEMVLHTLETIGSVDRVDSWYKRAREKKQKVMGFGHRVYKAYDPRARVLKPLAEYMAHENSKAKHLYGIANELETAVVSTLGAEKGVFPNVDFYSGIVYSAMGVPVEMFTPIFAVSRVAGWTARVLEYLQKNRIFRPRAIYTGEFGRTFVPMDERN